MKARKLLKQEKPVTRWAVPSIPKGSRKRRRLRPLCILIPISGNSNLIVFCAIDDDPSQYEIRQNCLCSTYSCGWLYNSLIFLSISKLIRQIHYFGSSNLCRLLSRDEFLRCEKRKRISDAYLVIIFRKIYC